MCNGEKAKSINQKRKENVSTDMDSTDMVSTYMCFFTTTNISNIITSSKTELYEVTTLTVYNLYILLVKNE